MHMIPVFVGGIIFVVLGTGLIAFRRRWSVLFTRLDDYAQLPAARRKSRPVNFLVFGILVAAVGVGWILVAVANQPWQ